MSFILRRLFGTSPSGTMEAAQKKAQQLIDENAVMVFSKSYCPYCTRTKQILDGLNAKYKAIELNLLDDGADIQNALLNLTGQRTVPNIFIGRNHIGGNSDLEEVSRNGKDGKSLEELLKDAGAL
ncbi:thioredoxin-like protein [Thermothelomyces heterothallicus CBS 202.75]|uniref:thioredoxin-like protein n=1 Tax=Thermothelomyces heterothallicus CBS 202.75 TaxID=1149848 RepID=UPI003744987C